jgi:hypothetical protein
LRIDRNKAQLKTIMKSRSLRARQVRQSRSLPAEANAGRDW